MLKPRNRRRVSGDTAGRDSRMVVVAAVVGGLALMGAGVVTSGLLSLVT